jgi:hypothetical protein
LSYRRTAPIPGGRRERRLRETSRNRLTRQLGVTLAVVAFAAGSFASATADTLRQGGASASAVGAAAVAPVEAVAPNVQVKTVTAEEPVAHGKVTKSDPMAMKGTTRVVTKGQAGSELVSYDVTYVNGIEVSRVRNISVVVDAPTTEVVSVGTLVIPKTTAAQQGSNRALGQQMAADIYGWSGSQWLCLDNLWTRESNWRTEAGNKSSGAYGIPQALPASKMATAGSDYLTNPATQIRWGLSYIKNRYGTPCGAWSHFTSSNWY